MSQHRNRHGLAPRAAPSGGSSDTTRLSRSTWARPTPRSSRTTPTTRASRSPTQCDAPIRMLSYIAAAQDRGVFDQHLRERGS